MVEWYLPRWNSPNSPKQSEAALAGRWLSPHFPSKDIKFWPVFVVMKLKIDWCKGPPFIFICQSVYTRRLMSRRNFKIFFFRFSKVKVVILFEIKIVFLIFFCWCRVEFLWSLEFRNYLQYSWFWRVLTGFYEKEKNHEVMHFVNTLKKTSTVYLQIVTVQSVLRFP